MAQAVEGSAPASLVAVTTNAADTAELAAWLERQLPAHTVTTCTGYYAAVAALSSGAPVAVVETPIEDARDEWRLAELRARAPEATILVVGDASLLPALTGALRADLAVTRTADLPPLRELLLTATPAVATDDQTNRRRSNR
ncbi:MAG TPA: hypothetical protein VFT62_09325 [Mycobacteriales bacterium]|nr:hypothetical protein [Mycobacteriales bacterium]